MESQGSKALSWTMFCSDICFLLPVLCINTKYSVEEDDRDDDDDEEYGDGPIDDDNDDGRLMKSKFKAQIC